MLRPIIPVIAGPTAVGKTTTSILVAEALGAEIISADSRQIYRDLPIVTAAPTPEEMARVSHHLVGELDLSVPYSAGDFAARVEPLIGTLRDQGKNVVVTGGSTLYVHALLEGLSDIPKVDPSIREKLNKRFEREGSSTLYQELVEVDPAFAASLDETKSQRIIRGLEIWIGTGKPLSSFHTPPPFSNYDFRLFVLFRERAQLYKRIDERVDQMIKGGLLDEVEQVADATRGNDYNSLKTIGYQELTPFLSKDITLAEATVLIKRNSRRYAKRQLTWYKRYPNAVWIDVDKTHAASHIVETLLSVK